MKPGRQPGRDVCLKACDVPAHFNSRLNVSLLTSMVGVGVRSCVIVPVQVQGHIVLAHQVHDLQNATNVKR